MMFSFLCKKTAQPPLHNDQPAWCIVQLSRGEVDIFCAQYQANDRQIEMLQLSKDRLILLEGTHGSLAHLGIPELTWTHTPGHSPGHIVLAHDSGNMLGGDFADVINDHGTATLKCMGECASPATQHSICKIAKDLEWSRIWPYHDAYKTGYTKAELLPMAVQYAGCSM